MIFACSNCENSWRYPIKICLFCGHEVKKQKAHLMTVRAVTRVDVPSSGHERVPYYNLLLEDDEGKLFLRKQLKKVSIGQEFVEETAQKQSLTIGIVGTGIMATGLASLLLQYDYPLIVTGRSHASLEKCKGQIRKFLLKGFDEEEVNRRMDSGIFVLGLDALAKADLIIESIAEELTAKHEILRQVEQVCSDKAMIATNTSSFSITELAAVLDHPERFLGLHFFNPVARMQLVEVVKGKNTAVETMEKGKKFAEDVGKSPVAVIDNPCFIVNRVLMPFLNEAAKVYDEGVASVEDIDKAAVLGLNHPIGPLALIDLIGVDIFVNILGNLERMLGDGYEPAKKALALFKDGAVGRKAGKGFYSYEK